MNYSEIVQSSRKDFNMKFQVGDKIKHPAWEEIETVILLDNGELALDNGDEIHLITDLSVSLDEYELWTK